ncbi:YciI family protein [Streptomyces sp. SID161]|uniref:YciI family protein n=1 Tax=Streptomyces sp. SID161 TaxID=2690251 RepID=UPI0019291591|nr:YciI family protein [Streptomyces sp. SID161]
MFVIVFRYRAPLETIDALKDAHYANPDGVFARGLARLAGPLEPRTGGLVVAEGERAEIEAAVASDPFVTSGAATAEILRFHPTWPPERAATDAVRHQGPASATVAVGDQGSASATVAVGEQGPAASPWRSDAGSGRRRPDGQG